MYLTSRCPIQELFSIFSRCDLFTNYNFEMAAKRIGDRGLVTSRISILAFQSFPNLLVEYVKVSKQDRAIFLLCSIFDFPKEKRN